MMRPFPPGAPCETLKGGAPVASCRCDAARALSRVATSERRPRSVLRRGLKFGYSTREAAAGGGLCRRKRTHSAQTRAVIRPRAGATPFSAGWSLCAQPATRALDAVVANSRERGAVANCCNLLRRRRPRTYDAFHHNQPTARRFGTKNEDQQRDTIPRRKRRRKSALLAR